VTLAQQSGELDVAARRVPFVNFPAQYAEEREAVLACVDEVFGKGDFVGGAAIALLEQELAAAVGVKHAVALNSGTDAPVPDPGLLATMTSRLEHRGPDGEGFYESDVASLGHRRLAVIDPEGGHQPVGTPDGLVQLTYNGEVYNFRELRSDLEGVGHRFSTACDTEVVLQAYLEWGTSCFARFRRRTKEAVDHVTCRSLAETASSAGIGRTA